MLLSCGTVRAGEETARWRSLDWREISAGAEATRNGWSVHSTMTAAPFGTLGEDGFRVRTTGGYGRYRYDGMRTVGTRKIEVPTEFKGTVSFTDILLGIQAQSGFATFKMFAGAAAIGHAVKPFDDGNDVQGLDVSFKGVLETWMELGGPWWAAIDVSKTGAHDSYAGRLRLGWRWQPELSIGADLGVHGNTSFDGGKAGAFVRWAPEWGELSLTGGVTGELDQPDTPFVSVNWLMRY